MLLVKVIYCFLYLFKDIIFGSPIRKMKVNILDHFECFRGGENVLLVGYPKLSRVWKLLQVLFLQCSHSSGKGGNKVLQHLNYKLIIPSILLLVSLVVCLKAVKRCIVRMWHSIWLHLKLNIQFNWEEYLFSSINFRVCTSVTYQKGESDFLCW